MTIRQILEGLRAQNLEANLLFFDCSNISDSITRWKMEQILLAYSISKETDPAMMMLYKNTKVKIRFPDVDTAYIDIVPGVLKGDALAPCLFIIFLDDVLGKSIDKMKDNVSS